MPNASHLVEPTVLITPFETQTKRAPCGRPFCLDGGEGGIRTLDTLLTYTPLAGERLQPLGHFSRFCLFRSDLPFALDDRALLGASHLALRVAAVPPAILRSLGLLGQPLGRFS